MQEPGTDAERAEAERGIRELLDAGRNADAVSLGLERYGEELYGFIFAIVRADADADDLFAELCERLWTKLPQFSGRSTFRTWCYAIARNLVHDAQRSWQRKRQREVAWSQRALEIAEHVRSTTLQHMKAESRERLEELRRTLDPDDRTLLVLSLDRCMPWREIAEVMADGEADEADLVRVAARLRKRFERIKSRLREQLLAGR